MIERRERMLSQRRVERTEEQNSPPLRGQAPPTIGLLVNEVVGGTQSGRFWDGVVDVAAANNLNVLCFAGHRLQDTEGYNARANIIYEFVDKARLDGLIVWASALASYVGVQRLQEFYTRFHPLPIVSVGMFVQGTPSIILDSYQGMREAIIHLIEVHGRRHLAFIRGPETHREAAERYRAYLDVLREYGLELSPARTSPPSDWNPEEGARAIHLLLVERRVDIDAVVAVSDNMAAAALGALHAHGVHVPNDVAVVGFNNQPVSATVNPPLTTVPLRMYERGKQAAEMLLGLLAGQPVPQRVTLPAHLLVRQSCGCPDPAVTQAAISAHKESVTALELSTSGTSPGPIIGAAECQQMLLEMEQAVEITEETSKWTQELLDAFLSELGGKAQGSFIQTLQDVLSWVAESAGEVIAWERVISALRRHMAPLLLNDKARLIRAEDLWHQARVTIGERARHVQAHHAWQTERQFDQVRQVGQATTTALTTPELMRVLAAELPKLDIRRCYLSLYEDPQKPTEWSRLVLAFNETGDLPLEPGGCRFPSRQLIPAGFLSPEKRYDLIVEPLNFREEQLGFLMLDGRSLRGRFHALLRDRISSALKGVLLLQQNVELYHLARQAQQVAQERERAAEEANASKSRFLSMVSHELLTPLVLLVGLSEIMLQEGAQDGSGAPERYQHDLQRIHASARQLDSLVRDVLDLARGHVNQLKLVKKPLDLGQTLKAVALIGEEMAHAKGLEWRADIPSDLPRVLGDPTRLAQVTMNLVTNACKFTARGHVTLKAESDGNQVTVSVSDTGLGVPLPDQRLIFDEFHQSQRTATRGCGGLGIGLAICRQLVELHGGQIGVISSGDKNDGSMFYFALPVLTPSADAEAVQSTPSRTVAVLTERAEGAEPLQAHLTQQGFVVRVIDVRETPDWLAAVLTAPPGALVFDFQPVSKRAWELIELLKSSPATQEIPVFFLALSQEQGCGAVLALDYLTKPMPTEALEQALARYGLQPQAPARAQTILVVDDDLEILDMHARTVQTHLPNCRVLKAPNGRVALELMQQETPALVLLDLMMPELDGMGVLEAMQANERTRQVPVVVLTAQRLTQADMERLNRGVATVLEKGMYSLKETLTHLGQALARNKRLGSETRRIVRKVMAHIHECYAEPVSREMMARHAGVSERHLTRCFRQEIGITPIEYLNRYRIKQAKQALDLKDSTITQVAHAVGFSDLSYFARVFRREVGVSPRQYQSNASTRRSA